MSTLTLEVPPIDAFDESQEPTVALELSPADLLRGAILYADLRQIRHIVENFNIDLSNPSSRPAGLAFTAIKHLGPRKSVEQVNALAWLCDHGLYDDNDKLRDVVRGMIADGVQN